MARDELEDQDPENLNEELLEGEGEEEEEKEPSGAPGWFISVGVHSLFALIYYAVWATHEEDTELPPMKVTTIDPPPKKEEKKDLERQLETTVEINVASEADVAAPINNLEVPLEEKTTSEDDNNADIAKGREEAVASSETGSTGAFMAIGAGGGSAGMFGNRNGGGKRRALAKGGGTRASESAVDAALRWFKRHQSPNGMWDAEKYPVNCTETPKCEPGKGHGSSDANVAMTGYAVLCFLGAGYDHKTPNKYKTTVEKGLEYLRSVQTGEGNLGPRNYEHAVATMALGEAFAMTNDPDLKQPAQKGLNVLIARQLKDGGKDGKNGSDPYSGLGWDYVEPKAERIDSSVSGWCVMALKSGLAGGLNIGNAMDGAKKWLKRHWEASNPDFKKLSDPYADTSTFAYTWDTTSDKVEVGAPGSGAHDMAPVGALCAVFLGHHAGDIMLETLCNHVMKYQFPAKYPCNTYYMYYNTLAVFQAGGQRWDKWNNSVRDMLVNAQRKGDGCFDGSWDFEGTVFHGSDTGRVLSTAYCCLSLEVYYRYKQVGGK
jgi:hypothetical protein